MAEGHTHRSLGYHPRDCYSHQPFGRRPYSPKRRRCIAEYGLRPMIVALSRSWGVAPGYDEYGLRPILSYTGTRYCGRRRAAEGQASGLSVSGRDWPCCAGRIKCAQPGGDSKGLQVSV